MRRWEKVMTMIWLVEGFLIAGNMLTGTICVSECTITDMVPL